MTPRAQILSSRESRFRAIYVEHALMVRRIVHRICGRDELDDIVQTAWVKIYRHFEEVHEAGAMKAWVGRVAMNAARDRLRARARRRWLQLFAGAEEPERVDEHASADARLLAEERVRAALASLSPKLRETIILFSIGELEIKEIAEVLRVPEGTVKSRLNQAREKLGALGGEV